MCASMYIFRLTSNPSPYSERVHTVTPRDQPILLPCACPTFSCHRLDQHSHTGSTPMIFFLLTTSRPKTSENKQRGRAGGQGRTVYVGSRTGIFPPQLSIRVPVTKRGAAAYLEGTVRVVTMKTEYNSRYSK